MRGIRRDTGQYVKIGADEPTGLHCDVDAEMNSHEIQVARLQERQGGGVLEYLPDAGRRPLEHRVVGVRNDDALGFEHQFRLDGRIGRLERRRQDHVHFALQQPAAQGGAGSGADLQVDVGALRPDPAGERPDERAHRGGPHAQPHQSGLPPGQPFEFAAEQ